MELRKRKEISLRKFLLQYFIRLCLSLSAVAVLWLLLLVLAVSCGPVIPANVTEQAVLDWLEQLPSETEVTPDMIPAGADYALFSLDGTLTATNLTGDTLSEARRLASAGQNIHTNISPSRIYRVVVTNSQLVVVTYHMRATFANAVLQRIFPSADVFFLLLLFLFLLADIIFISFFHAKRLEKELLPLQQTSEQIRAQNLDFPLPHTRFREYNHILESLGALKEELQHSLKEQWQLEQLKKKQMSALAHDIKTPLTIVKGNAELLAESSLDPEQRACTDYILENAVQIQDYVTRIIEVSKDSCLPVTGARIPLSELLAQIERNVIRLGQDKELSFVLDAEDISPDILIPWDAVSRSLWNLLDNAVQYSPKHGTITLRVQIQKAVVLLFEVTDEGPGFSPEALRYAAAEFYRADTSRNSSEHFGMGLAIARRIVTELGGTLQFANRPEGGAIVSMTIPTNENLPHSGSACSL